MVFNWFLSVVVVFWTCSGACCLGTVKSLFPWHWRRRYWDQSVSGAQSNHLGCHCSSTELADTSPGDSRKILELWICYFPLLSVSLIGKSVILLYTLPMSSVWYIYVYNKVCSVSTGYRILFPVSSSLQHTSLSPYHSSCTAKISSSLKTACQRRTLLFSTSIWGEDTSLQLWVIVRTFQKKSCAQSYK